MITRACLGLLSALIALAPVAGAAQEAPRLANARALGNEKGALLISIRSQQIFAEKLHVWFAREGADTPQTNNIMMFERVQGFGGPPMLRSLPRAYALPPGKYRLFAHMVGCGGALPASGKSCAIVVRLDPRHPVELPTHLYEGDVPTFVVEAGKLTEAGEFVLEYEPGPLPNTLNVDPAIARMRWKPIASAVPADLALLPRASSPTIPDAYRSRITCENPRSGLIKPTVLPFAC